MVDMATHRPVELLADRQADTFADWLREHPGTKVVCRDRAGAYADGANKPTRGHPWPCRSLTAGTCGTTSPSTSRSWWPAIAAACASPNLNPAAAGPDCRTRLPDPIAGPDLAQVSTQRAEQSTLVKRTQQRYAAVQALQAEGKGIKPIMRELGLAKQTVQTVRRFARASSVEELLAKPRPSPERDGPASSTSSSPTCTSAGTRATPAPPVCSRRSAPRATAAALASSVTTCVPSGNSASHRHWCPRRPRSAT
jgi:hypothetical protein